MKKNQKIKKEQKFERENHKYCNCDVNSILYGIIDVVVNNSNKTESN
jgi:hypothetical protein